MSTEGPRAAEIVGPSQYDVIRTSFVRFWSSTKLAVVLLLAIAVASALGTIVPQGEPSGIFALEGVSDRAKSVLVALTAFDVYYSAWYLGLLALFFLNLGVCTYVRAWPRLKYALRRPVEIPVPARDHMPEQHLFPGVSVEALGAALRKSGFRTLPMADGGFAADKGRAFRFAPMVVHLGIFIILGGSIIAGLMGFKHSFPLMPGETMPVRQSMMDAKARGILTPRPADFEVRLDKFWRTFYDDGSVRQFYSTLSVLEKDVVKVQKTIHVNEPLVHEGVYYYQSFWGLGGERFTIDRNGHREIALDNPPGKPGEPDLASSKAIELAGREVYVVHALEPPNSPVGIFDAHEGAMLGILHPGESVKIGQSFVRYDGPIFFSGLQTKSDPGIPLMYLGFVIVICGTLMGTGSHKQIWVSPMDGGCRTGGKANRGLFLFHGDMTRLRRRLVPPGAKFPQVVE